MGGVAIFGVGAEDDSESFGGVGDGAVFSGRRRLSCCWLRLAVDKGTGHLVDAVRTCSRGLCCQARIGAEGRSASLLT